MNAYKYIHDTCRCFPEASDVAAEASIFLSAGALAAVAVACASGCVIVCVGERERERE